MAPQLVAAAAPMLVLAVCLLSLAPASAWQKGRITWYDDDPSMSIDRGSCMQGYINSPTPMVGAMADVNPAYGGSCGRCYEIKCDPGDFKDNYGEELDRDHVCYDAEASVVISITDTCPCNYPSNYYSNKRWCCGDMDHFDISIWAFERLASTKWGVIGMQYRAVDCGTQPAKPAQLPAGKSPSPRRGPAGSSSSSSSSSSSGGGGSSSSSQSSSSGGSGSSSQSSSSSNSGSSSSSSQSSSSSSNGKKLL